MTQSGGMYMDAPADGRERKMALVMVRSFFFDAEANRTSVGARDDVVIN